MAGRDLRACSRAWKRRCARAIGSLHAVARWYAAKVWFGSATTVVYSPPISPRFGARLRRSKARGSAAELGDYS